MSIHELLANNKALLSDGAWGTELAKKGLEPGDCPELMNIENPDVIKEIAQKYIEAGSDIILTNTFGGNPYKLAKYGFESRVEEINKAGVGLSKEAAGDKALVFASIGPTGEFLAPLGITTEDEIIEAFSRQVKAFVQGGADGVVIETMTDLGEVIGALKAVKRYSDLPAVCSMTFDKGQRGYATMMGVKPEDAVKVLEDAGADIVGSNCGAGIDNMIDLANLIAPMTNLPLWFKPNAGLPELIQGETVFRETPEQMSSRIGELINAGTRIIGGCCGTTPEHIRRFRETLNSLERS